MVACHARSIEVISCGRACAALLECVAELPGVSSALDRLTSAASVAGAPASSAATVTLHAATRHEQDGCFCRSTTSCLQVSACCKPSSINHVWCYAGGHAAGSQGWRLGWGLAANPATVSPAQAACVAVLRCRSPTADVRPPFDASCCKRAALVPSRLHTGTMKTHHILTNPLQLGARC